MFAQRESERRAQVNFHNLKHRRDSVGLLGGHQKVL
jgi:hypothetical protein